MNPINRFYKLRIKRQKFLNHVQRFKNCKLAKVISNFINIKCSLCASPVIERIIFDCKLRILKSILKNKLAYIEDELYHLHSQLSHLLTNFQALDSIPWIKSSKTRSQHQKHLDNKFNRLLNDRNKQNFHHNHKLPIVNKNPIINVSNVTLSEREEKVLKLNSNFAQTLPISAPQIIAPIEKCFKHSKLSSLQKETSHLKQCHLQ